MIHAGLLRHGRRLLGAAMALALAACASAPLHYYTLVPAATDPVAATSRPMAASLPFELLPVTVPAQVDQPQLLVREGGQGVTLLNNERWIAPLADELRSALSTDLTRQMHSQDVSALPGNDRQPVLRIKLDVRRFDSLPGSYALIDAAWSIRVMHGAGGGQGATLACTSRVSEPVGAGYDALVQGHQRAIGELAAQIAAAAQSLGNGQTPGCPRA